MQDRPLQDGFRSPLVRFLLKHLALGTFGGFLFGGLLIWQDVANLRTLIWSSGEPILWLVLMFFGLFITFGSLGMGWAVMSMGEERDE